MAEIDKTVKSIINALMDFAVPEGMTSKERAKLAKKAGLSPETLRTMAWRKTVNADTLIRLLIARGVDPKLLANLPQSKTSQIDDSERDWIRFGHKLSSKERSNFISLIKFLKTRWELK